MTTSRLASMFSPMEMTATSTSWTPAVLSARSSLASSSTADRMTSACFWTRSVVGVDADDVLPELRQRRGHGGAEAAQADDRKCLLLH